MNTVLLMAKRTLVLVLACMVALVAPACDQSPSGSSGGAKATPPENVYTVRGRIVELPEKDKPASSLQIEHEPIANFVRQNGTLGMDSMIMPFSTNKGLSLEGIAVGDAVEFTFEVRWKSQPHLQVTKIVKLPPRTELHLGEAKSGD
jgi:Cu/Ag efflux protein CusF